MRITFLLIALILLGYLFVWVTFSGFFFYLGLFLITLFTVISVGYVDTALLFFLGAREVKHNDAEGFYAAATQEAYKLATALPRLYLYNGKLERAFVLENQKSLSLVLGRELIKICTQEELSAICFELLLQVKKGQAAKRTKVMFLIGVFGWFVHATIGWLYRIIPFPEFRHSLNWLANYLIVPWIDFLFRFSLGEKYFRQLYLYLQDFPIENEILKQVGSKIRKTSEIYSLPSRKYIEFASRAKNSYFHNILIIEFLPHEWDFLFELKVED
jgi:Zn-dependent protease with chaperone function